MKAYLSGGIEFAADFGKDWRLELEGWLQSELRHDVFNPTSESIQFFKLNYPDFERKELKNKSEEYIREIIGKLVKYECNEIIKNCDYVICFWDESCYKGAGTQGELTVSKYFNKPVFIVTKIDMKNIPSWIVGCSEKIFSDFNELKKFLSNSFS